METELAALQGSCPPRAGGCYKGRDRRPADRDLSGKLGAVGRVCTPHPHPQALKDSGWCGMCLAGLAGPAGPAGPAGLAVTVPALPAASFMTLGETLPLSKPQFPHLSKEGVKRKPDEENWGMRKQ